MTYGLERRLFVENGPAVRASEARVARSSTIYRAWRELDADRRIAMIERALRPAANDSIDAYPIAL